MIANGTKFGRYEIRSLIGAGGMGEVYLAEDLRPRRKIALKVLPENIAQDIEPNIWAQPVCDGQSKQLITFNSERAFWSDILCDGKQIALSRDILTSDIILIKDFK